MIPVAGEQGGAEPRDPGGANSENHPLDPWNQALFGSLGVFGNLPGPWAGPGTKIVYGVR
jgi:hypothetical protein